MDEMICKEELEENLEHAQVIDSEVTGSPPERHEVHESRMKDKLEDDIDSETATYLIKMEEESVETETIINKPVAKFKLNLSKVNLVSTHKINLTKGIEKEWILNHY